MQKTTFTPTGRTSVSRRIAAYFVTVDRRAVGMVRRSASGWVALSTVSRQTRDGFETRDAAGAWLAEEARPS